MKRAIENPDASHGRAPAATLLCAVCWRTIQEIYKTKANHRPNLKIRHHGTLQALQKSAAEGCALCCYLDHNATPPRAYSDGTVRDWDYSVDDSINAGEWDRGWMIQTHGLLVVLYQWKQDALLRHNRFRIQSYDRVTSSSSLQCITLLRQWITECRTSHKTCDRLRGSDSVDWMPTRLIYCGDSKGTIQIHEGSQIHARTPYMTLSHCWGTLPHPIKLTTSNIEAWKSNIPSLANMRTFHDAIYITRACGVSYLWIDSLCIQQDSEEDWKRESRMMELVYKYSLCNISATSAWDDTHGCFFPRPPRSLPLVTFDMNSQENADMQKEKITLEVCDRSPVGSESRYGPVNRRGWVVQERILSPRVVHFCQHQLFWECDYHTASERFPAGEPDMDKTFDLERIKLFKQTSDNIYSIHHHLPRPLSLWMEVLDLYSSTELTREDDVLIAISAIAREIQHRLKVRYIAGIFETHVIFQLCWQSNTARPRRGCESPSWSWAASKRRSSIIHSWKNPVPLAEYESAHAELRDADPFGRVLRGSITLKGTLIPLIVRDLRAVPGYLDRAVVEVPLAEKFALSPSSLRYVDDGALDSEPVRTGMTCFCLPLLFDVPGHFWGIVLHSVRPGLYQRIGFIEGDTALRLGSKLADHIGQLVVAPEDPTRVCGFLPRKAIWETIVIC